MVKVLIPKETVLGEFICQSCGNPTYIKMNNDGRLYHYCVSKGSYKDKTEVCRDKHWFSSLASQRLKDEFIEEIELQQKLKSEEIKTDVQLQEEPTRREDNTGTREPEATGGEQKPHGGVENFLNSIFE